MKKHILTFLYIACVSLVVFLQSSKEDRNGNLVGLLTKEDFLQGKYKSWFEEEYNAYQPKPSVVKKIKKLLDGIHIKAFFGTWYHDSHRELPRFFKTTDLAGFNVKDHFEMVGLTLEKKYPIIFKRFLISRIRQPLSSTKTGKKLVVT